ncbi:MAG: response regulator, partial [Euryarchaeota archaeon]|nr:response regulator [Euryarchaeota archaeon]
ELRHEGIDFISRLVESKEDFIRELEEFKPELILADHSLPQFDGISALKIAKKKRPQIPFIFVSGKIGEEFAVEVLREGATDYVLKNNLSKLVPAVQRALNEANEQVQRKKMYEALMESEKRYHSLFEHSPISIWEEDFSKVKNHIDKLRALGVRDFRKYFEDHPEEIEKYVKMIKVLEVNKESLKFFGVSQKEDIINNLSYYFFEESWNVFKEEIIALAEGNTSFASEIPIQTMKGEKKILDLKLSVTPGFEDTLLQVLVSFIDITERRKMEDQIKASLKEKEILLREVHHRVKNNMQIISSLIGLQSEYAGDKDVVEMFEDGKNRIRSMALVHEKLYQSENIAQIDFAEYIRSLITGLLNSYKLDDETINLKLNVDKVLLDIDTAIPCGLIINELVSNSLKHAFPDNRKGEVGVTLNSADKNFKLIVSDDGVGFPEDLEFTNTETLGLRIVNTLVAQLDGDIQLDRSKGTSFEIAFKEQET